MADNQHEVTVTDIKIPFWSMVVLMVKWALAAIPAIIILVIIGIIVSSRLRCTRCSAARWAGSGARGG